MSNCCIPGTQQADAGSFFGDSLPPRQIRVNKNYSRYPINGDSWYDTTTGNIFIYRDGTWTMIGNAGADTKQYEYVNYGFLASPAVGDIVRQLTGNGKMINLIVNKWGLNNPIFLNNNVNLSPNQIYDSVNDSCDNVYTMETSATTTVVAIKKFNVGFNQLYVLFLATTITFNEQNPKSVKSMCVDVNDDLYIGTVFQGMVNTRDSDNTISAYSLTSNNMLNDILISKYSEDGFTQWILQMSVLNTNASFMLKPQVRATTSLIMTCTVFSPTQSNTVLFGLPNTPITTTENFSLRISLGQGTFTTILAKYDLNGMAIWSTKIVTLNQVVTGKPNVVEIDQCGNYYVMGNFSDNVFFYNSGNLGSSNVSPIYILSSVSTVIEYYLAKYNSDGQFVWAAKTSGADLRDNLYDGGDIKIDNNNNIIFTGMFKSLFPFVFLVFYQSDGSESKYILERTTTLADDVFIYIINPDGFLMRSNQIGKGGLDTNGIHNPTVAIDSCNNIFISGNFDASSINFYNPYYTPNAGNIAGDMLNMVAGLNNIFVVKYNSDGIYQFSTRVGDVSNSINNQIIINNFDQLYLTSIITATGPATITYSTADINAQYTISSGPLGTGGAYTLSRFVDETKTIRSIGIITSVINPTTVEVQFNNVIEYNVQPLLVGTVYFLDGSTKSLDKCLLTNKTCNGICPNRCVGVADTIDSIRWKPYDVIASKKELSGCSSKESFASTNIKNFAYTNAIGQVIPTVGKLAVIDYKSPISSFVKTLDCNKWVVTSNLTNSNTGYTNIYAPQENEMANSHCGNTILVIENPSINTIFLTEFNSIDLSTIFTAGLSVTGASGSISFGTNINFMDEVRVEVDPVDNIYVSGHFQGQITPFNGNTIYPAKTITSIGAFSTFGAKFGSDGTPIFMVKATTNGTGHVIQSDISTDENENVYLAGIFQNKFLYFNDAGNTGISYTLGATGGLTSVGIFATDFVSKYNLNGNIIWATSITTNVPFNVSVDANLRFIRIVNDHEGDLYATGIFKNQAKFYNVGGTLAATQVGIVNTLGGFVVNYNNNGVVQWSTLIQATGSINSLDIIVDNSDNIIVIGNCTGVLTLFNSDSFSNLGFPNNFGVNTANSMYMFIAKYDRNGILIWGTLVTALFPSMLNGLILASSVKVDSCNNIMVGMSYAPKQVAMVFTCYNSDGTIGFLGNAPKQPSDQLVLMYNDSGFFKSFARVSGSQVNNPQYNVAVSVNKYDQIFTSGFLTWNVPTAITFYDNPADNTNPIYGFTATSPCNQYIAKFGNESYDASAIGVITNVLGTNNPELYIVDAQFSGTMQFNNQVFQLGKPYYINNTTCALTANCSTNGCNNRFVGVACSQNQILWNVLGPIAGR